jgi:hypothetical protein
MLLVKTLVGIKDIKARLKYIRGGESMRGLVKDVIRITNETVATYFRTEGRTTNKGGQPWAALSEDYLAWRKRHFPGSGTAILSRTGLLAKSISFYVVEVKDGWIRLQTKVPLSYEIVTRSDRPKSYEVRMKAKKKIKKFTPTRYGLLHLTGTDDLPRRPWVVSTDQVYLRELAKSYARYKPTRFGKL